MLSRIKETIRILSYREPHDGRDIVFVEHHEPTGSSVGIRIAHTLQVMLVVGIISPLAGFASKYLEQVIPSKSIAFSTLAAGVGALSMVLVHWLRGELQQTLFSHLNISSTCAPYFGHRIEEAIRTLKGQQVRAS